MRPLWTASCTACGERENFRAKGNPPLALSFCVVGSAASHCRARGATGIERIDELQHIPDRAPAFGRSAPRLLLVPALCALSGRFLLLRRLLRKGGAGRCRVMHPVCIVARYVGEILQQAIETDVLVVIAANCGRCVRSTKFCVFVVQHAHTREECEEKLKALIVEMKAEIAEAQRLMDLGEGDGRPPEEQSN